MNQQIDLRSDTVTKPSGGMRQAMAAAEVGDDVFGEDPTVRRLEERVADLLGKESALFCPSGTMGNLVAVATAADRGEEALCDSEAHIVHYELAGAAVVAGVQIRTFNGERAGCPTTSQLERMERLADPSHEPRTALLCLEQSSNRRGGTVAPLDLLDEACSTAKAMGMRVHLDGARLANAAAFLGEPLSRLARGADSVMLSLSKGLGAPAGSLWVGDAEARRRAHIWRKRLGGGMRQIGVLAAAGLWGLDHNLERLPEDHLKARRLAEDLQDVGGLSVDPGSVETNIVLIATEMDAQRVVDALGEVGVLTVPFGAHTLRCVTHLDVSDEQVIEAARRIRKAVDQIAS